MGLDGKVALITGAGSGLGEAAAMALAEAGVAVALSGRRREKLDKVAGAIEAAGGKALVLQGDVAIEEQATRAVEDTVAQLGRIDILVNSAGVNEFGGIESLSIDQWRRVLDINLMGTIYTCRAAFPHMKAQGSGDIINISSTAGRRAGWRTAAYSTSKFGLTGFTESLRQEAGRVGIRVGIVEPGSTATDIASSISDPQAAAFIHQRVTGEGAMGAKDIADAIMLIVSLPRRANVTRILVQPTVDVEPMP